jgi:hypothetical protein
MSARVPGRDDIADTGDMQFGLANAYPAIIDAYVREQPPLLFNDPGVFRTIARIMHVKRLKGASGKFILR